jgi:hypothetical protein
MICADQIVSDPQMTQMRKVKRRLGGASSRPGQECGQLIAIVSFSYLRHLRITPLMLLLQIPKKISESYPNFSCLSEGYPLAIG